MRRFPVKNRRSVTAGISETPQDTIVRASTPTARPARSPRRHRSSSGRSGSRNGQVMASRGGLPASDGHPIATAASALPSSCRSRRPRKSRGERPPRRRAVEYRALAAVVADDPIRIRDAGRKRLKGRTPQCAPHLPGERLSGVRGVVASPYCSLWCRIKPRFWALRSLSIAALLSLSCCADPNAEMSKAKATASNRIARLNGAVIT